MNKSESKYFATAAKMDEAFLQLLEKKDFAYITVKEICASAGVNRSTFYLHYETTSDLLAERVRYMNQQFMDYMAQDKKTFAALPVNGESAVPSLFSKLQNCPKEELCLVTPDYLTPYLNYIREHKRLFCTAMQGRMCLTWMTHIGGCLRMCLHRFWNATMCHRKTDVI